MRISEALYRKQSNSWGQEVTRDDASSWLSRSQSFNNWVSSAEDKEEFINKNHNDEFLINLYDDFVKERREYLKDSDLVVPYNEFVEAAKKVTMNKTAQDVGNGSSVPSVDTGELALPSSGGVKNKDIPNPRKKRRKKRAKEELWEMEGDPPLQKLPNYRPQHRKPESLEDFEEENNEKLIYEVWVQEYDKDPELLGTLDNEDDAYAAINKIDNDETIPLRDIYEDYWVEEKMEKQAASVEKELGEATDEQRFPNVVLVFDHVITSLGGLGDLLRLAQDTVNYPKVAAIFNNVGISPPKYIKITEDLTKMLELAKSEHEASVMRGTTKRSFIDRIAQVNPVEKILDHLIQLEDMKDKLYLMTGDYRQFQFTDPQAEQVGRNMIDNITKAANFIEWLMGNMSYLQELEETD